MKIEALLIFLILIIPLACAVEFNLNSEFSQGETLIAKVSGNFLDSITKENINFYRGHVKIPINFEVSKINEDFYIYSQLLDKEPNNYSIEIENVRYYKANNIVDDKITKNFTITSEFADFSVSPGFKLTNKDFYLELQNLKDNSIIVDISTIENSETKSFFASLFEDNTEEIDSVTLKSGEIKKINFNIKQISEPTLKTIKLSTENLEYEIPIYLYPNESFKNISRFEFEPSTLDIELATNSSTKRIIYLHNSGDADLKNISLSFSPAFDSFLNLSTTQINEIKANENFKIELEINSGLKEEEIQGQLKAKIGENLFTYVALSLNFIKDFIPLEEEIKISKNCSELDGIICSENQVCSEKTIYSLDGNCCLAKCEEKPSNSSGKIVGWAILIIVVTLVFWFFIKYKNVSSKIPFLSKN